MKRPRSLPGAEAARAAGRRWFLKLALLGGLAVVFKRVLWPAPLKPDEARTLIAYLETLIPGGATPGAVDLGLPQWLARKAAAERRYRRLLKKGCDWLEQQATDNYGRSFAALAEIERERIVAAAENSPFGAPVQTFFQCTRRDAFDFYYAQARGWYALPALHPPQPEGYIDFQTPPNPRTRA